MGKYFGTDGIRGVVNEFLTFDIAYKCGRALCEVVKNPKVYIGRDSRLSGEFLTLAVASGVVAGGGDVVDIGICTTPGIAYVTKYMKGDFGVVISASHNPPEYNGIKIFNKDGVKLGEDNENLLESLFEKSVKKKSCVLGSYTQKHYLVQKYIDYLINNCDYSLKNLKIIIDGSNGAGGKIAPKVFRKLGAKVIAINCRNDGKNINNNCGALYPQKLIEAVKNYNADIGFALDGDADRLIVVDEKGNIVDGDNIIYILAKQFAKENKLTKNTVVGTKHTNEGIVLKLKEDGINFIRTDIGDKYVCEKMSDEGFDLGGEKSGHIIIRDYLMTGDGILAGIKIAEIIKKNNKLISEINDVQLFPQINVDCVVKNKQKVITNCDVVDTIKREEMMIGNDSRLLVRASGTENKIRIMAEGRDRVKLTKCVYAIKEIIEKIDRDSRV